VTLAGGRTTELAPVSLTDGTWGGRLPIDATKVRTVAMIDRSGNQYCVARFGEWS
jgi:Tfp pilus assembly protein PilW